MKNIFQDRTAWIIGASSGIGEALTFRLNQLQCRTIISSRRIDELERIKNSALYPENITILILDLLDFSLFKEKTEQAFYYGNSIDYVFLNGGTSFRGLIFDTLLETHKRMMDLNYFSYAGLTKEILPFFEKQHKGHFVVTSSVMGKIGTPRRSAYAASKHALHGFFDCLRAETAKDSIRVTILTPGHIATDISFHTLTADGSPKMERNKIHDQGLSAEKAALQILHAVRKNKNEVFIGKKFGLEHISLFLMRFVPDFLHKMVRKFPSA
jgi:short-subunit dehydrogenase